ncbi:hypothetical protein BofuT4_P098130.1 [Botrytis cinerea T4]|uniref:Uncharacterized protein n=1 Tax=Botryotinia fuckeliana (strain T4) TaxID=999810 RepID=G2YCK8_BOTF4|nr:hypothetical protein BofuT4_P098130.1 [Botrytis cinerea T4]
MHTFKTNQGRSILVYIDLGTGGHRMAFSIEGNKIVKESETILERKQPNGDEPSKPVAFGYFKPRRRQKFVSGVKIAFLQDPESYGYAYAALVDAADDQLRSV